MSNWNLIKGQTTKRTDKNTTPQPVYHHDFVIKFFITLCQVQLLTLDFTLLINHFHDKSLAVQLQEPSWTVFTTISVEVLLLGQV